MIVATTTQQDPQGTKKKQNNKVRFVRTKEGERRYGKPIGSVIVSDTDMENIKYLGNTKNGWGVFKGKNGKRYQVGKVDGLWVATPFGDSTRKHSLVEGGDLQATLKALNRRAGNKAERREDTEYDRNKRAGRRGTVTGEKPASTRKRKTSKRKKASDTFEEETGTGSSSSRRSSSRSSSGGSSTSKAKNKKVTKKKGDYTGPNLQGLKRLVNAGLGNASSGAERAAAAKVMKELERQGLVKRTKVKGKIKYLPADGYSASDVAAGATESNRIDKIMYDLQRSEEKAMAVAQEIEARANVMFAELKGLRLYDGDVSSLEQKDMGGGMELKVRRVRTPAGVRRFGLPIGSIIGSRGKLLKNIKIEEPVFEDWDLVKDNKGKKYDVGKDDDGKWRAFGHNDWDDMVVEADSEDAVFEALDKKLGGGEAEAPAPAKKPRAKRREWTLGRIEEEQPELYNELLDNFDDDEMDEYIRIRNEEGRGHSRAMQIIEERRGSIHTVGEEPKKQNEESNKTPKTRKSSIDVDRPKITERQQAEVDALGKEAQDRYWKARTSGISKANHKNAMIAAKATARAVRANEKMTAGKDRSEWSERAINREIGEDRAHLVGISLTAAQRKKFYDEYRSGKSYSEAFDAAKKKRQGTNKPTKAELAEVVKNLRTATQRNQYSRLREKGTSHKEALKQAGSYKAPAVDDERRQWQEDQAERRRNGDVRRAVDSRRVAERTQGAGKPKAERTDAEIEASLNNAFRKQFDTLSGSQKRKYFAAFRQGKTHSEAMAAARGGSGKAQGTLF